MGSDPKRPRRFTYSSIEFLSRRHKGSLSDPAVKGLRYIRVGPGVYAQHRVWDKTKPVARGKHKGELGAYVVTELGVMPDTLELKKRAAAQGTTLGELAEQVLEAVRAKARQLPNRQRTALGLPEAPTPPGVHTVAELADRYLELEGPKLKPKTLANARSFVDRFVKPNLGAMRVDAVKHLDIATLHAGVGKKTPPQANRLQSLLSVMFAHALKWDWTEANPAKGVKHFAERKRERWLSEAELERLGAVLDRYADNPSAQAIKLLTLTGARKSEVLGAKWSEFSGLDGPEPTWTVPAIRTKKAEKIVRQLDPVAVELLSSLPKDGPFLFPSPTRSGKPMGDIKRFWARVAREAELDLGDGPDKLVLHSLRHTVASHIMSDGGELLTVARQLGHSSIKTTQRYAHLSKGKQRETMTGFGKKLGRATPGGAR